MVEIILDPYDAFRDSDFTAEVEDMGIKLYGETETPKAFIKFSDGSADLTFFINKTDGNLMVEPEGKIKSFSDLGSFAKAAKTFGYKVALDPDPESFNFRTIPPLIGKVTSWKAKKSGKKINADGTEGKEYTNFLLTEIREHGAPEKPAASDKVTAPPATPPVDYKQSWKDLLTEILSKPLNEAMINKAILDNDKTSNASDTVKAMHSAMAKVRKATLGELVKEKFLTITPDAKYELVI